MNRVFRGALFPILIVIVLAFFVAKLVSPPASTGVVHNYASLLQQDLPQHHGRHLEQHDQRDARGRRALLGRL
jgi:hypothetical protein